MRCFMAERVPCMGRAAAYYTENHPECLAKMREGIDAGLAPADVLAGVPAELEAFRGRVAAHLLHG